MIISPELLRKELWRTLLLAPGVIMLPLALLMPLALVGSGMTLGFLADVVVENASSELLRVTPIGTVDKEGTRRQLPIYDKDDRIPAWQTANLRLRPGESITITYDWDDINFSEIAVRRPTGEYRMMVVNPTPTEGCCAPPATDRLRVPPFSDLVAIDPRVQAAAERGSANRVFWLVLVGGPTSLLCLTLSVVVGRFRSPS